MGDHRADRRNCSRRSRSLETSATLPTGPGKRRANKHLTSRSGLFGALSSTPLLLGSVALALSAGGAVTAADSALSSHETSARLGAATTVNGVSTVSRASLLAERRIVVSRDLRRDERSSDVDADLVEAAERQARARIAALAQLATQAEARSADLELNEWSLPVDVVELTAGFGDVGLWADYHTGLDFNGDTGDPVYSVGSGVVTSAVYDGAYGYKTVVTLDDGTEIWFAHQNSIQVDEGDVVRGGEQIGTIGSTGNVTGSHLHLEVRPSAGAPVDPYAAFQVRGLL